MVKNMANDMELVFYKGVIGIGFLKILGVPFWVTSALEQGRAHVSAGRVPSRPRKGTILGVQIIPR